MNNEHDLEQKRREGLDLIVESDDRFKLVVAGAGTGKTYLFKQLLLRNPGENVVLTFINNLADDMVKDIGDLAEVRTFHSFCRKLLHKLPSHGINGNFHFFPKLGQVVARDAEVLYPRISNHGKPPEKAFQEAFQALVEDDGRIEFFLNRANYYNAVGFDDSVYRVLGCFQDNPNTIPTIDQLILDEYQDFNALDVEFITHLETRSPTLIVGDDDQAIYDFRYASPAHLRTKAGSPHFTRFDLPFCSRCTEVVVRTTNAVIEKACSLALLADRVDKDYVCYMPDKRIDSQNYPTIIHCHCSTHNSRSPYIAMYIEKAIQQIPPEEIEQSLRENYPLVLVIGPSHYLRQIFEYLNDRFPNVIYRTSADMSLTLLDGYLCLMKDQLSNLGWRLISGIEAPEVLPSVLKESAKGQSAISDLVTDEFKQEHQQRLRMLLIFRLDENALTSLEKSDLESYFGMPIEQILKYVNKASQPDLGDIESILPDQEGPENGHPIIRLTTYSGCKGLSAGFTFVTGLEEGVFPKLNSSPTDTEVCQFIVALTRTRKECHLVSSGRFATNWNKPSVFIDWIPRDAVMRTIANKDYFAS